ncbi:MAG: DUF2484 family protein [Rhodobacterales bacterium]|nr:DUF2484 family protein [Rhodobacterales bacterium]NCT11548.1 DUF2484 family protein [Rhodobacterales bacterium]
MSLAFIAFCLWLVATASVGYLPAALRPRARLGLIGLSLPIILAAFLTQGWFPGLCALLGALTMFPAPVQMLVELGQARIASLRRVGTTA